MTDFKIADQTVRLAEAAYAVVKLNSYDRRDPMRAALEAALWIEMANLMANLSPRDILRWSAIVKKASNLK